MQLRNTIKKEFQNGWRSETEKIKMTNKKEINLNHIAKVEGHAHLSLKIEKNKVKKCELKATEGARFFEALVLGKKVEDVQEIVTRICGICSVAHSVASVQALEEAIKIKPDKEQKSIREILMIGERIRSNTTHLYFLSLPDYFNSDSILDLIKKNKKHQEKVNDALALISSGNKIIEIFGGREIHPFLSIREDFPKIDLNPLKGYLENSKTIIKKTIRLFSELNYPQLERECDYLSLKDPKNEDYATISGKITSNSGLIDDNDYKKHLRENIREYATSKFAIQQNNRPFVTGAIARLNNNYEQLDKESKSVLKNFSFPFKNPFYNNVAQAIELLYSTNRAIDIITEIQNDLKNNKNKNIMRKIRIKPGRGVSAVEAPRGTLFHEYKIDNQGRISYCNIITPTVQNLNMMEKDIISTVNKALEKRKNKNEIVIEVEKLIRAYDPCFSCSTHFLKVKWL